MINSGLTKRKWTGVSKTFAEMSQRPFGFLACVVWLLLFGLVAPNVMAEPPQRIVSMAPSLTETLFSLGLGDRVVGVTRYCDWPPEAAKKAQVGGFVDPNYEAVVSLRPDLVVLLTSHKDIKGKLESLGLKTLTVKQETVADIGESLQTIGQACGVSERAQAEVASINARVESVHKRLGETKRPRVLLSVGRDISGTSLGTIYAAGHGTFYDEIIHLAGGCNALTGDNPYPQLSAEGIISANPDIIVDIVGMQKEGSPTPDSMARQWKPLDTVEAVKKDRILVIADNYALRPGPRFPQLVEALARFIHPEIKWETR